MQNPIPSADDTINIRVTPKAAANKVKVEEQPDGSLLYRVYVTTVAEDGKANQAVIDLLAKTWRMKKSSFEIVQGLTHRNKVIRIHA